MFILCKAVFYFAIFVYISMGLEFFLLFFPRNGVVAGIVSQSSVVLRIYPFFFLSGTVGFLGFRS